MRHYYDRDDWAIRLFVFSIPDDETRTTILKMELETSILLDANSEVFLWDCEVYGTRLIGMTGAELVEACHKAEMHLP
jgi:hypothetical protein